MGHHLQRTGRRGRGQRDVEAEGVRKTRGEGDAEGGRARDGDLRFALLGELLQGGPALRGGGVGPGARRPAADEVRPGEQRERAHAVLLGAEDRRVSGLGRVRVWGGGPFRQEGGGGLRQFGRLWLSREADSAAGVWGQDRTKCAGTTASRVCVAGELVTATWCRDLQNLSRAWKK